jgi:hypothetical protein
LTAVKEQFEAGTVDSVEYEKAKLARDVAAAYFRQAQAAKTNPSSSVEEATHLFFGEPEWIC